MAKKQRVSVVGTMLTVEYPTIGKKFAVDFSKYSPEIQSAALAHGYKQKFGDAASGGTPAEKLAEVEAIHASLTSGEWERTASPDLTPLICEAVARIKKVPVAKILAVAEKAPDTVKSWSADLKVKATIAKIRAERAAALAEEDDTELEVPGLK